MADKSKTQQPESQCVKRRAPQPALHVSRDLTPQAQPAAALQRVLSAPRSRMRPADILALQRAVGNRTIQRLMTGLMQGQTQQEEEEGTPAHRKSLPSSVPLLAHSQNNERGAGTDPADAAQASKTGLPDKLKVGIESLSGMAMDDVEVNYNSSKPAEVQALAYTLGTQIHVGPGQEQYLPHEAWHVVQQKQGRVKPTMQAKEVAINDDQGLEKEADQMGNKAIQIKCAECEKDVAREENAVQAKTGDSRTMQLAKGDSCYCPGNPNSPYAGSLEYNDQIGPGEAFTSTTMTEIYRANAAKTTKAKIKGGVQSSYDSDSDGGALVKLSDVNNMIAEVDHIVPQVLRGCNSVKNAQVISSWENSPAQKGDNYPYGGYTSYSVFDPTTNIWYKNKKDAVNAGATKVGNL